MEDLDYAFNELRDYQRNTIKITPMNKTNYTAGEILELALPTNALLDISTFRLHFVAKTAGTGNTIALPRDIESIFERVQCSTRGQNIENSYNNYNLLFKTLLNITCDTSVELGQRSVYANGIGDTPAAAGDKGNFVAEKWLGFLGSAGVVYTGNEMLPDLRVQITFAPNSILSTADAAKDASYEITGVYATIDKIQGPEMLQMMLASVKSKPMLAFDNYAAYSDTKNNVKFGVNSSHLNKVLVVIRDPAFSTQAAQVGSVYDSAYFNTERKNCDLHQLLLGDTYYPQYQASGSNDALSDVMKAFGKGRDISVGSLITKTTYLSGRYCLCYNFEHLGSSGVLTGIDTRGLSTGATWQASSLDAGARVDVFPIMKSVLMFSPEGVMVQP